MQANTTPENLVEFAGMKARPTLPRGPCKQSCRAGANKAAATVPWLLLAVLCVGEAGSGGSPAPTGSAFVLPKPPATASWGPLTCLKCTAASVPGLNGAGERGANAGRRSTEEGKQRQRERPGPPKLLPPAGASSFWDQPKAGQHTVCLQCLAFSPLLGVLFNRRAFQNASSLHFSSHCSA